MKTYPEAFKARIISQMLPPHNRSIPELTLETGIPKETLYTWRGKNRPPSNTKTENRLTSQEKFHLVMESESLNEQESGEFCRSRGVFPEQLAAWRNACHDANEARPRWEDSAEWRELKRRNTELEVELRRKEKALAEAAVLLVLKKKARALWAEPEVENLPMRNGRR